MKIDMNCEHYKIVPKGGQKALCNCRKKNKKFLKWLKGQINQDRVLSKTK